MPIKQCQKFMSLKHHVMTCLLEKNVDNMPQKKIVSTTTTNMTILKCHFKQILQTKEPFLCAKLVAFMLLNMCIACFKTSCWKLKKLFAFENQQIWLKFNAISDGKKNKKSRLSRGRAKIVLCFFEFLFFAKRDAWFVNREVKEKLGKVKWELGCVMQGEKKLIFDPAVRDKSQTPAEWFGFKGEFCPAPKRKFKSNIRKGMPHAKAAIAN